MERHEEDRFHSSAESLFSANMRAARILFLNSPVMELLGVACFIPLLYYANSRIKENTLTLGLLSGMLFALFRMYDPIRKLSRLHVQFQRAFASASRITELLDTHVEIHDRPGARELAGVHDIGGVPGRELRVPSLHQPEVRSEEHRSQGASGTR